VVLIGTGIKPRTSNGSEISAVSGMGVPYCSDVVFYRLADMCPQLLRQKMWPCPKLKSKSDLNIAPIDCGASHADDDPLVIWIQIRFEGNVSDGAPHGREALPRLLNCGTAQPETCTGVRTDAD
jgi:hypothetical protein